MCGLAGIARPDPRVPVSRGCADADGTVVAPSRTRWLRPPARRGCRLGFGQACDLRPPRGWQPLVRPAEGSALVYNGEVYNHPELRAELSAAGELFETTSDTEVVHRLLERFGLAALDRLNGQFAFAWWEPRHRRVTLVRDRFGVRPLHYALLPDGTLVFGSEAKALFASGEVVAHPDLDGIDDVFTLWGVRPPHSAFAGIRQVPAGSVVVWERGEIVAERRWWAPSYGPDDPGPDDLEDLLRDSVRLRLRADVPVGTYLSGGLDSSLLTALAQEETQHELRTFSVAFRDRRFDERAEQEQVAAAIGTRHSSSKWAGRDRRRLRRRRLSRGDPPDQDSAGAVAPTRTRVREHGITVVATGEGADELFWVMTSSRKSSSAASRARTPSVRIELLDETYAYLGSAARRGPALAAVRAGDRRRRPSPRLAPHQVSGHGDGQGAVFPRRSRGGRCARSTACARRCPTALRAGKISSKASFLEVTTLLETYLLAAQGDRVAMASGVEGRYPFLDHRVFAQAAALPAREKLDGLADKRPLRRLAAKVCCPGIASRPKQPYRAPEVAPFFGPDAPDWVEEALSPESLG